MAIVSGDNYTHVDIVDGSTTTRHMLEDAQAREDVAELKNALQTGNESIENGTEKITGDRMLVFKNGVYKSADTTPAVGEAVSFTDNSAFVCTISECVEGDVFNAHVYGAVGAYRAFYFLDANMNILSLAGASYELNRDISAPANSAFVVFNNYLPSMASGFCAYKKGANSIDARLAIAETGVAKTASLVFTHKEKANITLTPSQVVTAAAKGDKWTDKVISSNTYSLIQNGLDVSQYNTFDGYIVIISTTIENSAAQYGFADANDNIIFVASNNAVTNEFVRYNQNTSKYELYIKVLGDKFFYSNKKTVINYAEFELVKIAPLDNPFYSLTPAWRSVKYVSAAGNDGNTGDEVSSSYATVAKALSEGAETIFVARGNYTEKINVVGKKINIIGDDAVFTNTGNNLYFTDCDVNIRGITSVCTGDAGTTLNGFRFIRCTGRVEDCAAINAPYMGYRISGSKLVFNRCIAQNAGVDGFNGHDTALDDDQSVIYTCECSFYDCKALDCGDDGLSFHEHGKMFVTGGEYARNVSTGIAPHQWCEAEIRNAYIHNNGANAHSSGIEAINPDYTTGDKARVMTYGNLITGNGKYGIDATNDILISVGDKFADNASGTVNTTGTGAEVTVYS